MLYCWPGADVKSNQKPMIITELVIPASLLEKVHNKIFVFGH